MKKIAFCFLIYDEIVNEELWNIFFNNIDKEMYNIYIHYKTDVPLKYFEKYKLLQSECINTNYGDYTLALAFNVLLRKSYMDDPENYKCIILSGTCIPFKSFDYIYDVLTKDNYGYFNMFPQEHCLEEYNAPMKKIYKENFAKASCWFILNRILIENLCFDKDDILRNFFILINAPEEFFYFTYIKLLGLENHVITTYNSATDATTFNNWTFMDYKYKSTRGVKNYSFISEEELHYLINSPCLFGRKFIKGCINSLNNKYYLDTITTSNFLGEVLLKTEPSCETREATKETKEFVGETESKTNPICETLKSTKETKEFVICAVFKNESHILEEWLLHYIYRGVEHFYLVNDNSNDEYQKIIDKYSNFITLFNNDIETKEVGRQILVYNKYFKNILNKSKWFAILDLDEFLYSPNSMNLIDILKKYEEYSQIRVNWLHYGSNDHYYQPNSVIEGFLKRAEVDEKKPYFSYKTIFKGCSLRSFNIHIHSVDGKDIYLKYIERVQPSPLSTSKFSVSATSSTEPILKTFQEVEKGDEIVCRRGGVEDVSDPRNSGVKDARVCRRGVVEDEADTQKSQTCRGDDEGIKSVSCKKIQPITSSLQPYPDIPELIINHYTIQSYDFFMRIKSTRGDLDNWFNHLKLSRDSEYFKGYDINNIFDDRLYQQNIKISSIVKINKVINNDMDDVTVVLTSCNRPELLEKTLISFVKYNTYKNIKETIIIDDSGIYGCNNNVLNKPYLKILNIKSIYNKTNIGQIQSIDKAYSYVKTKYIFHCEEDWEFLQPGFIEKSLKIFNDNPTEKIYTVWLRPHNCTSRHPIIYDDLNKGYYKMKPDFSYIEKGEKYTWCGFTFNPGLRRTTDCLLFHPYYLKCDKSIKNNKEYVGEYFLNKKYMECGFYAYILDDPKGHVNHIGWNQHIKRDWD